MPSSQPLISTTTVSAASKISMLSFVSAVFGLEIPAFRALELEVLPPLNPDFSKLPNPWVTPNPLFAV